MRWYVQCDPARAAAIRRQDLAAWAAEHKATFLEQCREWMRDCPSGARDGGALGLETAAAGSWPPGRLGR